MVPLLRDHDVPDGDERVSLHIEPYVKEDACASSGREFRTKNELTVRLVDRALEHVRPSVVVFDLWHGSQEVMGHLDSRGLRFVTESKSKQLIEGGGRKQVRDYLADHQNEFEEVETGTGYRFVHEMKNEIKGGLVVKFVLLKQRLVLKALVLMTNALDMPEDEVIIS